MKKISVIVPVYNVEIYLDRCVTSVLQQTYPCFELILVDDGATDRSGEICDRYAAMDERVRVLHKSNGGLSDARNVGISVAEGEFLTFIDSDDWVEKRYLEVLYNNLCLYNADISAVNLHAAYDMYNEKAFDIESRLCTGVQALELLYEKNYNIYVNVACAKLYKRELFSEIRYPVGRLHEDGFTTYKLIGMAEQVYFSNEDLYCYYQRDSSIMHQEFSLRRIDEYDVYVERIRYFKERKMHVLFLENERTRMSCMKTLSIKIACSNMSEEEKKKWLNIFREDMIANLGYQKLSRALLGTILFCVSPKLFVAVHR